VLIGWDAQRQLGVVIDTGKGTVSVGNNAVGIVFMAVAGTDKKPGDQESLSEATQEQYIIVIVDHHSRYMVAGTQATPPSAQDVVRAMRQK
jgi:hypothetical protein